TRCHQEAILLTGDGLLRRIAKEDGCRVHGVLWVVDELRRLTLCENSMLCAALELWRADPAVFLPVLEIDQRLRSFGRSYLPSRRRFGRPPSCCPRGARPLCGRGTCGVPASWRCWWRAARRGVLAWAAGQLIE